MLSGSRITAADTLSAQQVEGHLTATEAQSLNSPPSTLNPAAAEGSSSSVPCESAGPTSPASDPQPLPLDTLIPVRMLNEFTYCPRLGYLEWVQGEWADNLETLQGTFGHRNVDKPDRKQVKSPAAKGKSQSRRGHQSTEDATEASDQSDSDEEPSDESIHTRSITLSASGEGIVAKLDLLEIEGVHATPVDYKRGQVPDVPGGAYQPERVQLCAQGLILRENGFECTEGVIYFIGSRRRVTIPFDEELVALTRRQVVAFRATAAGGVSPPPLVDSPKCPRCSLVGICLPDETNFLRELHPLPSSADENSPSQDRVRRDRAMHDGLPSSADENSPSQPALRSETPTTKDGLRRLLPARHDALPLYVQEQGAYLGKSGERLTVSKQREEVFSTRLLDVSQVCLFGNITISAPALRELNVRGIPVCHFSYGGWFHGMTTGLVHNNVALRIRQYEIAADPAQSLPFAKAFVAGKIKNSRTLLRRHLGDRHAPVLRQLAEYYRRVRRVESVESLLGLEGMAAKDYFAGFFTLIAGQHEFDVNGRNRRPPRDPVNAVLSFVYSLLTKELTVTLQSAGFDPMLGFMHRPRFSRPSLALDLAEEFRPLIADSVTLTALNNGEVDRDSFIERAGEVTMTPAGRRSVLAAFERRLETEITHPLFGYKVSYRRILEVQSRLLARTIMHEIDTYPNFCTR